MRRLGFFLFGVLLAAFLLAPYAHAETIPATANTSNKETLYYWDANPCSSLARSPDFSTAQLAYSYWVSTWPRTMVCDPQHNPTTLTLVNSSFDGSTVSATWKASWSSTQQWSGSEPVKSYQGCKTGTADSSGSCVTYSCPVNQGWTLSGSSCSRTDCQPGEVRDENGQCRSACRPGTKLKSGWYQDTNGDGKINSGCFSGCKGDFKGTGPSYVYWGQYQSTPGYVGDFIANGETCSSGSTPDSIVQPPNQPPNQPVTDSMEYKCASQGMGWGEVNGQIVCVPPSSSASQPYQNPPQKETQKNPDGTKTETETQDVQNGENVTRTTTTKTYDAAGNPVSSTTKTTTAPVGKFCESNPEAAICKQSKTTGGGDCATPPQSSGDAIQAAIALQAWHTRCEVQKQNDRITEAKQWADDQLAGLGNEENPLDNPISKNVLDMFDDTNLLGTRACPAPKVMATPLGTYYLPFDQFCDLAAMVGHLILIFASFLSFRIVIGAL